MKKLLLVVLAWVIAGTAMAWEPVGTVRVIVGYGPGSLSEHVARQIILAIEKNNPKVSFVIENYPGNNGMTAMNYFAEQTPNGYALLSAAQEATFIAAPNAPNNRIKVDPMNYTMVSAIATQPTLFVVPANSKLNTVPELVAHLKNSNNKFNIGLSGSTKLLIYGYLVDSLKLSPDQVQMISYRSPADVAMGVARGELDMALLEYGVVGAMIGSRVKIIGYTGNKKIPSFENISLVKDSIPGLTMGVTYSLFLPPGTPVEIANWYATQIHLALKTPDLKKFMESSPGMTVSAESQGPENYLNSTMAMKKSWDHVAKKVLQEVKE